MIKKEDIKLKAYQEAIKTLEACSTKNGFFASGGKGGYNAVWARDSMIASLGAGLVEGGKFKGVFEKSLVTLAKHQSEQGEIPNAVDKFSKRKSHVDYKSIDSSLWYVIGHYIYAKRFNSRLLKEYNSSIKNALNWIRCQGSADGGMLRQLPTTDWQDAFPHKYGYTINSQALYYKVLKLVGKRMMASGLRLKVNKDIDDKLWNSNYYLAYRWKNHNKYKEIGDWFDSLGNLLAIVFGLADEKQAGKIISYIKKHKLAEPYPIMAIYPPITKKSKYWQDYFRDCDAKDSYHYANAGIWGFIGGFYVLSLIKMKRFKEAWTELEKLADRNLNGNFPEWTNPKTKESFGSLQAWEAGMYILAYESLKKKRCLI